jgi:pyridoxine 5-phosphate synthase
MSQDARCFAGNRCARTDRVIQSRPIELTVVIDGVVQMREQHIWPHPDPLEFALAAERAGADGILLSLNVDHVAAHDRDWRMMSDLRHARLCLAVPPRATMLQIAAASAAARCVLIPTSRHEHSSGGALAVAVVREELRAAGRLFEDAGIELAARIDPDPVAVSLCAEAGLSSVEFNVAAFALASRPQSGARRLEELRKAVDAARANRLRVSVRGGLDYRNVRDLVSSVEVAEIRIGQALISRALFDGIEASIARMRNCLGGSVT